MAAAEAVVAAAARMVMAFVKCIVGEVVFDRPAVGLLCVGEWK